jgi:outer membrane protein assembly factor BamB
MSLRPTLERERSRYRLSPDAFDRLVDERDRRRRRERIVTVVVAVALAAVAVAGAFAVFRVGERSTPAQDRSGRITPSNVRSLRVLWRAPMLHRAGTVTIADGVVIAITDLEGLPSHVQPQVFAYATDCATDGQTCAPLWQAAIRSAGQMPDGPLVVDGTVYIAGDRLYAFPLHCRSDGLSCPPSWTAPIPGAPTQPVADDHALYVGSTAGRVYAFPLTCGETQAACRPIWASVATDLPLLVSAVSDGRVLASVLALDEATPHLNRLYEFDTSCSTPCAPSEVVDVRGQAFASMPAVLDGIAYVGTAANGGEGSLRAYDAACGLRASCLLWSLEEHEALNIPRPVAGDGIVVTAARLVTHRIRAYASGSQAPEGPRWTACCVDQISDSSPVVVDGLVYVASLFDGLLAYPVDCRTQPLCRASWSWPGEQPIGASGAVDVAVGDGVLVAAARAEALVAFAPAPLPHGLSGGDRRSAEAFYGAVVLLGTAALVLRRRRRRGW